MVKVTYSQTTVASEMGWTRFVMIDILIPNVQAWVESAIKSLRTGRDVRSIVLSTIKVSVGAYIYGLGRSQTGQ